MVLIKKMVEDFGSVKRYCKINGINYSSFRTIKSLNFQTLAGQRYLLKLIDDNLIDLEYAVICKKLFKGRVNG